MTGAAPGCLVRDGKMLRCQARKSAPPFLKKFAQRGKGGGGGALVAPLQSQVTVQTWHIDIQTLHQNCSLSVCATNHSN